MGLWRSMNSWTYNNYNHHFFPRTRRNLKPTDCASGRLVLGFGNHVFFSVRLSRTPSKSVVLMNQSCLGFATGASQLHIIIYRYTYYYYHYSILNKYSSRLQAINATLSIQSEVF